MNLTPEQVKAVNEEVANFLDDLKKQIKDHGIEGIGINFESIHTGCLLDEATDALANGDMLRCIVMHAMEGMSMFKEDEEG